MFDAVVISLSDPEPAARTFAGLVEGVVQGMVRRVVLLSAQESEGLRKLADAAGCRLLDSVLPGHIGEALKPTLETNEVLVLAAGVLLPPGWPDLLRMDLQHKGPPEGLGGLALRPAGLAASLRLRASITGRRRVPLTHGVLAPRGSVTARTFDGIALKAGPGWRMADMKVALMPVRAKAKPLTPPAP